MSYYQDVIIGNPNGVKIIKINNGIKYLLLKPTHYDNIYKAYELLYYCPLNNTGSLSNSPMFVIEIVNEETKEYKLLEIKTLDRE